MLLIAQAADQSFGLFVTLPAILLLAYLMIFKPEMAKAKQQRAMIEGLKKNDRVLTASGIIGVITNVQRDIDRITVKVDETTNTTLKMTAGSVVRVLSDDPTDTKTQS